VMRQLWAAEGSSSLGWGSAVELSQSEYKEDE
jgi:hypothetical protein